MICRCVVYQYNKQFSQVIRSCHLILHKLYDNICLQKSVDSLTYLSGYQIAPFFIDSFMQKKYYDVNYLHLFCAQMAILPLKKVFVKWLKCVLCKNV